MLARVYKLTEGKLPLIGVGGIDSGDAAVAKIKAGASLLQLYTGLVFEGPRLIGDIKQALLKAMQEARADNLSALVGRDAGALDRSRVLSLKHHHACLISLQARSRIYTLASALGFR